MGRTNGKLINFLKVCLMKLAYINLRHDSEDPDTFQIELPRYEKHKDLSEYEKILKAWYQCNGKTHLYKSYSNAKAVFQAALKKSIYLVQLRKVGKVLRYKFATKEEAEEKRLLLKEKSKDQDPNHEFMLEASSLSPSSPPSESSSGYHSENEFGSLDSPVHENVMDESLIDEILKDPTIRDKVLPCDLIEDFFMDQTESPDLCDNSFDDLVQLLGDNLVQEPQPLIEDVALESQQLMCPASLPMSVQVDHESKSVLEVNPIPVLNSNISKKFFWRCKQKMTFDKSTLLLICDREVIEDENNIINEGQIFIPNEVWEPGVSYKLQEVTKVGDKNFVFFSQSSV